MKTIVGAGLAGLIAAHAWPQARLYEASPRAAQGHRALLRFRTDAVSRLTGIEFRAVKVRKGIWSRGAFVAPNIASANSYARKCLGKLVGERSIWSLDPVQRFIAPDDFYDQLLGNVGERVSWGYEFDYAACRDPIISTAPLPVVLTSLRIETPIRFERAPITVQRFRVEGADVYQTVYFPDVMTDVYRASITGDTLIVESMSDVGPNDLEQVREAFCLLSSSLTPLETVTQRYGKIAPVDDRARKDLLFRLTHEHNIFSLGRFATYRNTLLDDVVDDIAAIKKLARTGAYELRQQTR
jgi:hypothetical protein